MTKTPPHAMFSAEQEIQECPRLHNLASGPETPPTRHHVRLSRTPQRRRDHRPHSKSVIHQYCQKTNIRQTTTSDALSQEPQVPTITIRVTVLNDWGYPERNLQVKMRYNMPFWRTCRFVPDKVRYARVLWSGNEGTQKGWRKSRWCQTYL
jgi:hypothetical protein